VLRYWETRFDQLRPMKRADGRRCYRQENMDVLRLLQNLVQGRGLSLRDALRVLADERAGEGGVTPCGEPATAGALPEDASVSAPSAPSFSASADAPPKVDAGLAAAARLGRSVGELQAMVREAVTRGEFGEAALAENEAARQRLENLLSGLDRIKDRMDEVRNAEAA
jgi:DNA-binding transcriptional MerR regulator